MEDREDRKAMDILHKKAHENENEHKHKHDHKHNRYEYNNHKASVSAFRYIIKMFGTTLMELRSSIGKEVLGEHILLNYILTYF